MLVAILAGGSGIRMGGAKPLRILGGRNLIERAITAARVWSPHVIAVGRDPEQIGSSAIPFLRDAPGAEGPIAGLAAALHHARDNRYSLVLTLPCDTPFLPTDLAQRLSAHLPPTSNAAVPASGGVLHASCALWRTQVLDALKPYLASGRSSLRGLASDVGYVAVEWLVEVRDPFFNINSPGDLAAAQEWLRAGEDP